MNTAQPIRDKNDLEKFINYYREEEKNTRNQLLLVMGLNTALRVSDLLSLRWEDVYDVKKKDFCGHISITEAKTGKRTCIFINEGIRLALEAYRGEREEKEDAPLCGRRFLFEGNGGAHICRVQAYRIIRKAAEKCRLSGVISPHSLRKTFGYYAWKQGTPPVLLMEIYHHSSFSITQRYLGIEQDDCDEVFKSVCLK